jgi:hypothetical protein
METVTVLRRDCPTAFMLAVRCELLPACPRRTTVPTRATPYRDRSTRIRYIDFELCTASNTPLGERPTSAACLDGISSFLISSSSLRTTLRATRGLWTLADLNRNRVEPLNCSSRVPCASSFHIASLSLGLDAPAYRCYYTFLLLRLELVTSLLLRVTATGRYVRTQWQG